jgi:hypothetical protein
MSIMMQTLRVAMDKDLLYTNYSCWAANRKCQSSLSKATNFSVGNSMLYLPKEASW